MLYNRPKTILFNIIASPFFLAIPISLAIIFFLPNPTSKYKVELTQKELADKSNSHKNFYDLNNDGIDECVMVFHNIVNGEAAIKVVTNTGINYDQWNFHGYFQKQPERYYCADLDNDGYSEIYVFYYKEDSVFMGAVQPFPDKKMIFKKKFISTVWKRAGKIDFAISTIKSADIDNDGFNEMVFFLNAGFSRQPRAVFVYDHQDNSIKSSQSIGAHFVNLVIDDLDNDSFPEIYCGSSAVANINDSLNIPYNDYSSWFIGYSNNFELLFPPIENSGIPSWVHICGFANNDGDKYIATYFVNLAKQNDKLVFYEANGKEYSSVTFDFLPEDRKKVSTFMVPVEVDNKPYILWGIIDGYFILYNENIEIKKIKTELNNFDFLFQGDLNKDGNEELVFRSQASEYLIISDNILKNTVWIETNIQTHTTKPFNWGIKHNGEKQDELFIKAEDFVYLYSYKANLLYYLKFPIWIIIYGFVTLILWFSQRLQHIQEKRKQQVEQTINSLQMKTIKSQMDPHFMFNVLTGLANNVATGNTKEAHDQILRFSQLLRSMMDRTNKIDISLAEEIEFVRSYLELEKFRFRDDFEYNIKIEDGVDLNMRLPRMLIQLLVENSIKHGLKTLSGTQKLNIDIHHKKGKTLVVVEDNGIGRKAAMEKSGITGKGMKLINEMIRLNRKMGGKEISVDHTDLYDEAGKAAGTRVMVEVSPRIARISTN